MCCSNNGLCLPGTQTWGHTSTVERARPVLLQVLGLALRVSLALTQHSLCSTHKGPSLKYINLGSCVLAFPLYESFLVTSYHHICRTSSKGDQLLHVGFNINNLMQVFKERLDVYVVKIESEKSQQPILRLLAFFTPLFSPHKHLIFLYSNVRWKF